MSGHPQLNALIISEKCFLNQEIYFSHKGLEMGVSLSNSAPASSQQRLLSLPTRVWEDLAFGDP
jgi:hypothetical protein